MQSLNFIKFAQDAAEQLISSEDSEYGGFGSKVKYPSPHNILFLLRYAAQYESLPARQAAERALKFMYFGGIHDHFAGGFFSGPCDREWLAPVFEKRLADNALLALAYTEAWQTGHMAIYRDAAEGALNFCLRELKGPSGLFADGLKERSGVEPGMCCSFTPEEITDILGEDGTHFCECYDITPEGNFRGRSIPNLLLNTRQFFVPEGYAEYRSALAEKAHERGCCESFGSFSVSSNSMLLMALSRAAKVFDSSRYLAKARSLADALSAAVLRDGAKTPNYAGAQAFFGLGMLELYSADLMPAFLEAARSAGQKLAVLIAENAEKLAAAPSETLYDGELPSAFDAAAVLTARLGALFSDTVFTKASDCLCSIMLRRADKFPAGFAFGLNAVMDRESGRKAVLEVSSSEEPSELLLSIGLRYNPDTDCLFSCPGSDRDLSVLLPAVSGLTPGYYTSRNGQFLPVG